MLERLSLLFNGVEDQFNMGRYRSRQWRSEGTEKSTKRERKAESKSNIEKEVTTDAARSNENARLHPDSLHLLPDHRSDLVAVLTDNEIAGSAKW